MKSKLLGMCLLMASAIALASVPLYPARDYDLAKTGTVVDVITTSHTLDNSPTDIKDYKTIFFSDGTNLTVDPSANITVSMSGVFYLKAIKTGLTWLTTPTTYTDTEYKLVRFKQG